MRYPLWAFFFVLVMPTFTAHALLTSKAELVLQDHSESTTPSAGVTYWAHNVTRN